MYSYGRTADIAKGKEWAQKEQNQLFSRPLDVDTLGDACYLVIPRGVSGRILRATSTVVVTLGTGAGAVGTIDLNIHPDGGGAAVLIGQWTLTAGAITPGTKDDDVTIAAAGAVPPHAFTGGEVLVASISAIRDDGAGTSVGEVAISVDLMVDSVAQEADAAVLGYLALL